MELNFTRVAGHSDTGQVVLCIVSLLVCRLSIQRWNGAGKKPWPLIIFSAVLVASTLAPVPRGVWIHREAMAAILAGVFILAFHHIAAKGLGSQVRTGFAVSTFAA